ncbi:unnamed protein product [Cyclocybe aegerita]|uniref:Uncharacterized protein n=1 Tax=Cyclocybe aegerita TaxID=1973307 RepID=A0A8S0WJ03_CYCAE|nr:unnamed protein product [Cyclocybe aegerita]
MRDVWMISQISGRSVKRELRIPVSSLNPPFRMAQYSVPLEAHDLFWRGLINNPLHASAPKEMREAAEHVKLDGSPSPTLPIVWRFAESISAIKAFQASMLNVFLQKKYGVDYQDIRINTDHAQLFIMSVIVATVDPDGEKIAYIDANYAKYYPDGDLYHGQGKRTKFSDDCTNIYRTKDGRFFHLHASLNAAPSQEALGLDNLLDTKDLTHEDSCRIYEGKISHHNATDIEALINDQYRQAGTTCWSTEEYKASEHGKANANVGLFEVHHIPNPKQAPGWWTPVEGHTSAARPLFGLKVLDLTRIIAGPTIARELAELGASVLRITSPNVTDLTIMGVDLSWGKWNAYLDLKKEEDRATLRALVEESDVVVDGYRPGVMQKWGFGKDDILGMFKDKERGIIYVHENCYGWRGPWAYRSGWQQISDANSGVSLEYGRAMGNDEPVTPVFPNSDYSTGVAGATGVLQALIEKSEKGGSFVVDVALNYYNQWLVDTCGKYPPAVWEALRSLYGRPVFVHTDNMAITIPRVMDMIKGAIIFQQDFFEIRENRAIGVPVKTVKPILQFPQGAIRLGYNIGSRGNGIDKPRWPDDLLTEIMA